MGLPLAGCFIYAARPTHVLIIDDAQVRLRPTTHRFLDSVRYRLYDLTLRRNWSFASSMRPNVIVFLGDMLASGYRVHEDENYTNYIQRFKGVFKIGKSAEAYFAPGNDDVGLRTEWKTARTARNHYVKHFGPMNGWVTVANHTFVILDAPGLVEEDYQRADKVLEYEEWEPKPDGVIEFLKSIAHIQAGDEGNDPVILFTHIPLSRPELASCGPLREKGTIHRGVGTNYQNTFGKKTTEFLLREIKPSLIFSGDDRDYCEYEHPLAFPGANDRAHVREVTVKSFSPTKHIRYPGFHLLSVAYPSAVPPHVRSFDDKPCLFPDHVHVYWDRYLPLAVLTVFILLISSYRQRRYPKHRSSLPSHSADALLDKGPYQWPPLDGDIVENLPPYFATSNSTFPTSPHDPFLPPLRTPTVSASSSHGNFRPTSTTPSLRASLYASSPIDSSFISSPTDTHFDEHLLSSGPSFQMINSPNESPLHIPSPYPLNKASSSGRQSMKMPWWKWSRSWTFVFRGRRRRMTITIPAIWRLLTFWIPSHDVVGRRSSQSLFVKILLTDIISVALPPFLLWTVLTLWTLR
ncbi:unnamed protein product [Somion occarium]|uniref:Calcineurin-like phosphoesterase domain-containing protein n=1 Tax=Somion occarium TaxID=3059160 RepID=A0ABP1DKP0_9APHY